MKTFRKSTGVTVLVASALIFAVSCAFPHEEEVAGNSGQVNPAPVLARIGALDLTGGGARGVPSARVVQSRGLGAVYSVITLEPIVKETVGVRLRLLDDDGEYLGTVIREMRLTDRTLFVDGKEYPVIADLEWNGQYGDTQHAFLMESGELDGQLGNWRWGQETGWYLDGDSSGNYFGGPGNSINDNSEKGMDTPKAGPDDMKNSLNRPGSSGGMMHNGPELPGAGDAQYEGDSLPGGLGAGGGFGAVFIMEKNGPGSVITEGGSLVTVHPDGSITFVNPGRDPRTMPADKGSSWRLGDGGTITRLPDGNIKIEDKGGQEWAIVDPETGAGVIGGTNREEEEIPPRSPEDEDGKGAEKEAALGAFGFHGFPGAGSIPKFDGFYGMPSINGGGLFGSRW